jgi:methyl-accepting chemotaxis protein
MRFPPLTIRRRLLLFGMLPALLILSAVLATNYVRFRSLLLRLAETAAGDVAREVALQLDRDTLAAVSTARTMAAAAAGGLFGDREASLACARRVLETTPGICGAYFGYEPDADGLDAESLSEGVLPPAAMDATGRFIPYWFRGHDDERAIELTPLVLLDGLYYAGCRERFRDAAWPDKWMVTEPYDYQGRLMVEHTYPLVIDGAFVGVAGVDRGLDELAAHLESLRGRLRVGGWNAEILVLSRLGRVVASTADRGLATRAVAETPYAGFVPARAAVTRSPADDATVTWVADDPIEGRRSLVAATAVPSARWQVIVHVAEADAVRQVRGTLLTAAATGGVGMAAVAGLLFWLASGLTVRVRRAMEAAARMATGDLSGDVGADGGHVPSRQESDGGDETAVLLGNIDRMRSGLLGIVSDVKQSSVDLAATAAEVSAAARQQDAAIQSLGASTTEAAAASREITATGRELVSTMQGVAAVATETAAAADAGRADLDVLARTMQAFASATAGMAGRLAGIQERAESITAVITTITKVADQTNLLSINAAIEAEKAGEHGLGFLVVAREIRRLADQTAVATLDIERLVADMQEAVTAGVGEMGRFSEEVEMGVSTVSAVGNRFSEVIDTVRGLTDRFERVGAGMEAQSLGAGQITESLGVLADSSAAAGSALGEFKLAAGRMVESASRLTASVSRFRLNAPVSDGETRAALERG